MISAEESRCTGGGTGAGAGSGAYLDSGGGGGSLRGMWKIIDLIEDSGTSRLPMTCRGREAWAMPRSVAIAFPRCN